MDLDFLEDAYLKMDKVKEILSIVPDLDDETQRECVADAAKTLRRLATVLGKAAKGYGHAIPGRL